MSMKKRIERAYFGAAGLVMAVLVTSPLYAQGGFGTIGTQTAEEAKGLATGLYALIVLGGLGFAAFGIVTILKANKREESVMPGVVMTLLGALLASIVFFVGAGSSSFFGSDKSSLTTIGIQ